MVLVGMWLATSMLALDFGVIAALTQNVGPIFRIMVGHEPRAMLDDPLAAIVNALRYYPVHFSTFA